MAMVAGVSPLPALATTGVQSGHAGVVIRDSGCPSEPAGAACVDARADLDLMIVDPRDPSRRGSTDSFSISVDPDLRAMVTAYDESGRLLGVAERSGDEATGGERLSLTGLGDIARVHISGRGPIAYADLRIAEIKDSGHLPEPATWAMLIAGFLLIGAVIRRRIRLSEARFTERLRRIASGEDA
ncbi:hypothetical protein GCM10011380_22430 [Sphingomonas metalli]|uniref:Ice-binding protein C-terminal domain-containing protein n=2 Tax=Sphingomonas metalli TaxID=1779358 RepID=A0A916WT95_9SPHN|nr:hypothetical protein GCM10011380_22430 [Sphingomonas metalli]